MSTWRITISRPQRASRGSVSIAALVTLVVGLTIVLGLMVATNGVFLSGKRQVVLCGARSQAEASVNYGYWQVIKNHALVPYSNSRNLGGGSFSVTVTDNGANIPGTIAVAGVGVNGSDSVARLVVSAVPKTPFDFALACNSTLSVGTTVVTGSSGANGDVYANGWLILSLFSVVNGNATATGPISAPLITGTAFASQPAITFPAINTTYYQNIANRSYTGSQSWSGFTFLAPYEVVFVSGSVTLNTGTISGTGTIVCTGQLSVNGSLTYGSSSCKMAVIAAQGISVAANCSIAGFYYTHNGSGTAMATLNTGVVASSGGIGADQINDAGILVTLIHDPAMNITLGQALHLPGYTN
jgi:2-keto-4-pentenoate hydratase/2-oxohepta-3-ene-1,7-dioic acid hydratase in catechol pathway